MQLDLEFYVKAYLPSLVNQKNIAYQVVQSTTHWAFILVGAVLAVVFNNPRFPNFWSLVVVGFLVLFVLHIGIRVAKGYVNQVRWNLLERHLLVLLHDTEKTDEEKAQDFNTLVRAYHCDWESPVGSARLARKVLFELGFFPMVGGIVGLFVYLYFRVAEVQLTYKRLVLAVVVLWGIWEAFAFRYISEYLRKVRRHPDIKF